MDPLENQELEEREFNIDDLIREFGGTVLSEEEQLAALEEKNRKEAEQAQADQSGTVRFEAVEQPKEEKAQVSQDTVSFEPLRTVTKDTVSFEPLPDDEEQTVEEPEPFAEDIDPEYDGMAVNMGPIAFSNKERLRQMRRKIVEGPEQRYYELMEKGTGKLRFALIVNSVVFLAVAATTVLHAFGLFEPERLRLLVFTQFFGLLMSALLGSGQLIDGLFDLFKLRFTTNSLLLVTFITCCVDGVFCLQQQRVSIAALFCLEVSMALWGTIHSRATEMNQMETMRHAVRLERVVCTTGYYKDRAGYCSEQGEIEDFMDNYSKLSTPEKVLNWYCFSVLLVAIALAVTAGLLHNVDTAVQVGAAALIMGLPATAAISLTRPAALLESRLHRLGTVLCGWQGIRAAGRKAVYPVEARDLFPVGSVKLNGVKFYHDSPDWVVALATAVVKKGGGALVEPFSNMLNSRDGRYFPVDSFQRYDGGIGGEVVGRSVLVGTRAFMKHQGMKLDAVAKVDHAVYVSVDGSIAAQFVVNYRKQKEMVQGLHTLSSYRGLTPMIMADDFMLTEEFMSHKLDVNTRRIRFPKREDREQMLAHRPKEGDPIVAVTVRDGLASKAYAVTGARVLRSALKAGVTVHLIGGILGLLIVGALAVVGITGVLTPANVLLYELIWMVPGLLITQWTKTV